MPKQPSTYTPNYIEVRSELAKIAQFEFEKLQPFRLNQIGARLRQLASVIDGKLENGQDKKAKEL